MHSRRQLLVAAVAALVGCRPAAGPSSEAVKKVAESLFERAARGEQVEGIHFTGQGSATPKLIASEIRARRRISQPEAYEYEVRLTYLNRIQQMEWATVAIRFEQRGNGWEPSLPETSH